MHLHNIITALETIHAELTAWQQPQLNRAPAGPGRNHVQRALVTVNQLLQAATVAQEAYEEHLETIQAERMLAAQIGAPW